MKWGAENTSVKDNYARTPSHASSLTPDTFEHKDKQADVLFNLCVRVPIDRLHPLGRVAHCNDAIGDVYTRSSGGGGAGKICEGESG